MFRTIAVATATVVATIAFSAPAAAGNVAWNVTVGGPGFALSAGQPGFGVGFATAPAIVGPVGWGPVVRHPRHRWAPRFVPAPVVFGPAPVWGPGFVDPAFAPVGAPVFVPVAGRGFATAGPVWRPVVAAPRVIVRRPVVVAPIMAPPMHRSWQY
jgi:hypothetical protein